MGKECSIKALPYNFLSVPNLGKVNENCYFHGLKTFLEIGSRAFVVPFTIGYDKKGYVTVKITRLHKTISALITLVSISLRIYESRLMHPSHQVKWGPPMFFKIIYGYWNIVFHCSLWYSLWQGSCYYRILKFVQNTVALPLPPKHLQTIFKILPYILWIQIFGISILSTFMGLTSDKWNFEIGFNTFISTGKKWFYLESIYSEPKVQTSWSICEIIFGIFTIISFYLRHVTGYLEELLIFMVVFTLWLSSFGFAKQVKELIASPIPLHIQWESLKVSYLAVKRLSDLINDAIWANILTHTVLSLFYYSFNFETLIMSKTVGHQISVIFYFLSALAFYGFGADICDQIKTFENWISKSTLENDRLNCIPMEQVQVLLHEIQERRVGIQCGKLTITYSMVASIMGVVMTYFIICVQFRLDVGVDQTD